MRTRVRTFAHTLERSGLALAGAACGMFVGAYVGSSIEWLTTQGFLLVMMISGGAGFYLGIDTPQMHFHPLDQAAQLAVPGRVQPDDVAPLEQLQVLLPGHGRAEVGGERRRIRQHRTGLGVPEDVPALLPVVVVDPAAAVQPLFQPGQQVR